MAAVAPRTSWTAKELLAAEDLDLTAAELVSEGLCFPSCLVAASEEASGCACRCGGAYHAVLANVPVPDSGRALSADPWYARYCGYAQPILDELCPVIRATVRASNEHYYQCQREREPFIVAQRGKRQRWITRYTSDPAARPGPPPKLSRDNAELLQRIIDALVQLRRVEGAYSGPEYVEASGVRTQEEAQVIGALIAELWFDNPDGARSCLRALTEDLEARR